MTTQTHPSIPVFGFTGHETFPFRVGWLHKGVMAVKADPRVFSNDDAIVSLGVGKNMVRAIRHWCVTLDLIMDSERGSYEVTDLGELIFAADGADPYLEDIGTLWWLHWKLATNIKRCTTWYYVFNYLNRPEFTKKSLMEGLLRACSDTGARVPSDRTIESDIDCFVKTYTAPRKVVTEESLECPLVELSIVKDDGNLLRFSRGEQSSMPDEIFLAALLEYYRGTGTQARTVSVERILHTEGSPGRVFMLDENSCIARLERLAELTNGSVAFDSTAGMRQILFHAVPDVLNVLKSYYRRGQ